MGPAFVGERRPMLKKDGKSAGGNPRTHFGMGRIVIDIGYFTTWPAKHGETEAECFANNFNDCRTVDEMGWDVVWTASTPLAGVNPEPFVLSSAIAGMTKQIKIGTAVHLLHNLKLPGEKYLTDVQAGGQTIVRRGIVAERRSYSFDQLLPPDPIIIAQEVAMVDHISNGRFIYGVGGDTAGDETRRRHFLEFLEVLKSIWTDEGDFSGFEGEFYNYPAPPAGMKISPKPVQKPHPPILLAVDSQQGFVPMGEMGYRVGIRGNIDAQRGTKYGKEGDSVLKQDVDKYRQAYIDAGHTGNPGVAIRIPTHVAATQKEANRFKEALAEERAQRAVAMGRPSPAAGRLDGRSANSTELFGTPEEVVDRIQELQELFGVDELLCELHLGNSVTRESMQKVMRVMTDKVLPKVK